MLANRQLNGSVWANPSVVYSAIWLAVLLLHSLMLTSHLVPPSFQGMFLACIGVVTSPFVYLYAVSATSKRKIKMPQLERLQDLLSLYIRIWLVGTCIDIFFSGGVPIYWALQGNFDLDYTKFGIPSVHGMLNALYLQIVTIYFYCHLVLKKSSIRPLVLLLLWPVLMLGRGILLGAILQIICVYLLHRKITIKNYFFGAVILLSVILVFGWVGDLRGTTNPFEGLVVDSAAELFEILPTGFLWFYVYSVSGVNNIFFNIDTFEPLYSLNYSVTNLVPSFVKKFFMDDSSVESLIYADSNLNTGTIYAGVFSDFGIFGCLFYMIFFQLFLSLLYVSAKRGNVAAVFMYAPFFQVLIFSPFYDMFLLLPTFFQVLISYYSFKFLTNSTHSLNLKLSK